MPSSTSFKSPCSAGNPVSNNYIPLSRPSHQNPSCDC